VHRSILCMIFSCNHAKMSWNVRDCTPLHTLHAHVAPFTQSRHARFACDRCGESRDTERADVANWTSSGLHVRATRGRSHPRALHMAGASTSVATTACMGALAIAHEFRTRHHGMHLIMTCIRHSTVTVRPVHVHNHPPALWMGVDGTRSISLHPYSHTTPTAHACTVTLTPIVLRCFSNLGGCASLPRTHCCTQNAQVEGTRAGPVQTAARVVVESNRSGKIVFDSGVVNTSRPELANRAPMPELALQSDTVYTWHVEVWTSDSPTPVVSAPAIFSTGLLEQSEWTAVWIRGGKQMRSTFSVASGTRVARATLFIAACQYYVAWIDGVRVGDFILDSPWTSFYTNRSYTTHVIDTAVLTPGACACPRACRAS
jgi:hypothetical protein